MSSPRVSRTAALWFLLVLSLLVHTILVAITIRLATSTLHQAVLRDLAISASVLALVDLVNLLVALVLLARLISQDGGPLRLVFDAGSIVIFLVAILLTIFTLSWATTAQHSHLHPSATDGAARSRLTAGIAIWVLDLAFQGSFFIVWVWPWTQPSPLAHLHDDPPCEQRNSPTRSIKRSMSFRLAALNIQAPQTAFSSPSRRSSPISHDFSDDLGAKTRAASATSMRKTSSLRLSIYQTVHPVTSRTKLLRSTLDSRDPRAVSLDGLHSIDGDERDDGFSSWDTSDVEESCENAMSQHHSRQVLETIPQSRPASPARPLDGPFHYNQERPEDIPLPSSPPSPGALMENASMPSVFFSPTSPNASMPNIFRSQTPTNSSMPNIFQSQTPTNRSTQSLNLVPGPRDSIMHDQRHIHPLFRTSSPALSPPLVSPGTVITASPYAGQVINPTLHENVQGDVVGEVLAPIMKRVSSNKSLNKLPSPGTDEVPDLPPLPHNAAG